MEVYVSVRLQFLITLSWHFYGPRYLMNHFSAEFSGRIQSLCQW